MNSYAVSFDILTKLYYGTVVYFTAHTHLDRFSMLWNLSIHSFFPLIFPLWKCPITSNLLQVVCVVFGHSVSPSMVEWEASEVSGHETGSEKKSEESENKMFFSVSGLPLSLTLYAPHTLRTHTHTHSFHRVNTHYSLQTQWQFSPPPSGINTGSHPQQAGLTI